MKMAYILRPLSTHNLSCYNRSTSFLHRFISPISKQQQEQRLPYASPPKPQDIQSRGLRLPPSRTSPEPIDLKEQTSSSESLDKKSRNEKKREARRAVKWGMELATFTAPQIKQILSACGIYKLDGRVASLDQEVFEAIMLVKRFGHDVREGKRRQFNYIGRLLREVQPELMDTLIQASKDGDQSKIQELSGAETLPISESEEEGEESESEEEEGSQNYINVASRWLEGLIVKDSDITKEVYAIHNVDFDRQELRKLVRRIHSIQSSQSSEESEGQNDAALVKARMSLTRFLQALAKRMPNE